MNIDANYVAEQIRHWLLTQSGAYLGSNYGENIKDYLQIPSSTRADDIIIKMREDIPILELVPQDNLGIYWKDKGFDSKKLVITAFGIDIEL